MTGTPREKLLGYLLDALDDEEREDLDREVASSPAFHAELTALAHELQPLSVLKGYHEPSPQLAERTCAAIWEQIDSDDATLDANDATKEFLATEVVEETVSVHDSPPLLLAAGNEAEWSDRFGEASHCETGHSEIGVPISPFPAAIAVSIATVTNNDREQLQETQEAIPRVVPVRRDPASARVRRPHIARRPEAVAPQPPHIRWASRVASISIGVLIALLTFPVILFIKDKVIARVYQVLMVGVEENMEYYQQIQETNAMVRARESTGSFLTASSQWHTLAPPAPSLPHTAGVVPTPEQLDAIPQITIGTVRADGETIAPSMEATGTLVASVPLAVPLTINDNIRLLADPKPPLGKASQLYQFAGESLFISGDTVYYRVIPMRTR